MELTDEQNAVVTKIREWLDAGQSQWMTLAGYAGTGKTVVVAALAQEHVAVVLAPTGKAVNVLAKKGVSAQTIHSWLYPQGPKETDDELEWPMPQPVVFARLCIVDESSMVDRTRFNDLTAQRQRFLFVGDHGQLEPVGDDSGVMRDPALKLETIHRQAAGSPIIAFAHRLRVGEKVEPCTSAGLVVTKRSEQKHDPDWLLSFDQVIVGKNTTRNGLNRVMRHKLGKYGVLQCGDKVVCLMNRKSPPIVNGQCGTVGRVISEDERTVTFDFLDDSGVLFPKVVAVRAQFGVPHTMKRPELSKIFPVVDVSAMTPDELLYALQDAKPFGPRDREFRESILDRYDPDLGEGDRLSEKQIGWIESIVSGRGRLPAQFDYSYALTAHKSQGSQWERVLVIEESASVWDQKRWSYTAATRAASHLTFVMQERPWPFQE